MTGMLQGMSLLLIKSGRTLSVECICICMYIACWQSPFVKPETVRL